MCKACHTAMDKMTRAIWGIGGCAGMVLGAPVAGITLAHGARPLGCVMRAGMMKWHYICLSAGLSGLGALHGLGALLLPPPGPEALGSSSLQGGPHGTLGSLPGSPAALQPFGLGRMGGPVEPGMQPRMRSRKPARLAGPAAANGAGAARAWAGGALPPPGPEVLACHVLRSPAVQRWVQYEWLYSALDRPWFARNELGALVCAVAGGATRMTRADWALLRGAWGGVGWSGARRGKAGQGG